MMLLDMNYWKERMKYFCIPLFLSVPVFASIGNIKLTLCYLLLAVLLTFLIHAIFYQIPINTLLYLQVAVLLEFMFRMKIEPNIWKIGSVIIGSLFIAFCLSKCEGILQNKWLAIAIIVCSFILYRFGIYDEKTKVLTTVNMKFFTIQMTDIIRFMSLLLIGKIMDTFDYADAKVKKLFLLLAFLTTMYLIYSEKGTLFVIYAAVLLTTLFTFYKNESRQLFIIVGLFLLLAAIAYGLYCFGLLPSRLMSQMNLILDRFSNSDPYQTIQAINGLVEGGLFGAVKPTINIPVTDSDFSIAGFIQTYGVISYLFLAVSALLFFSKTFTYSTIENKISLYPLIFALIFELFWTIFMNLGYLPVIGINPPFTSTGLTYNFTLFLSCFYVLFQVNHFD